MIWVADTAIDPPQVGFAIGRAVGPAVTRNRLRRRLRPLLTQEAATGGVPAGLYLIGARPGAGGQTFAQLAHSVTQLFSDVSRKIRR